MINGKWYPRGSALQHRASLSIQNKTFCVSIEGQKPLSGDIASIKVSDRIGCTERKLMLPDGSVFATADNEAVDRLMIPQSRIKRAIHYLESHLMWVLCSGILIVFLSFAFIRWGLPMISHQVAQILPQKTSEVIGQQSFAFIDKYFLAESRLNSQRKAAIHKRFQTKLIPSQKTSKIHYTLHFRGWLIDDVSIPNAFALPSGDIVLTDKLVELSQSPSEIDTVLLHEMGHVVHHHGLESVVRGSLITVITQLIIGNPDGLSDFAVSVATGVISSHYSRQQEIEADLYAFHRMLTLGINPKYFAQILHRMERYMADEVESELAENVEEKRSVLDYLSSHPRTSERAKQAKHFTECFEKGLKQCEPI